MNSIIPAAAPLFDRIAPNLPAINEQVKQSVPATKPAATKIEITNNTNNTTIKIKNALSTSASFESNMEKMVDDKNKPKPNNPLTKLPLDNFDIRQPPYGF